MVEEVCIYPSSDRCNMRIQMPSRAAIIAPNNSASVDEKDADRWTFENQVTKQPMKKNIAPDEENLVAQLEST